MRKKTRKKARSAKQLANDKRLGRMAKARAKAKRGGRRKKTVRKKNTHRKVTRRRANPKRKVSARSHLWLIFRCRGNSVHYLGPTSLWHAKRGVAVLFKTKAVAAKFARQVAKKRGNAGYDVGVCSDAQTKSQIAAACKAGK